MIILAIILILCGVIIKYGKMYFFLNAGYNTLPKKEKAKYKIDKIAKLIRNSTFGMALIILIGHFLSIWLEKPNIEIISLFVATGVGIPYLLIAVNSTKYKTKKNKPDSKQ